MPAIQPDLLKRQTAQIVDKFDEPQKFVRALNDHLDWYSDRTRRPGLNSPPPPILYTYRVPDQVIRELRRQLTPPAVQDPLASLVLADFLWEEENLECRMLAIDLLSWTPGDPYEPVEERLQKWVDPLEEAEVLDRLLTLGVARYRREAPDRFLRLAKDWVTSNDTPTQALGLQLLAGLVNDPSFTNLPVIYMRVKSLIQRAPSDLQPDLVNVVRALAERSPRETAHYIEECLRGAQGSGTASIIRGSLESFPPDIRKQLKSAIVDTS